MVTKSTVWKLFQDIFLGPWKIHNGDLIKFNRLMAWLLIKFLPSQANKNFDIFMSFSKKMTIDNLLALKLMVKQMKYFERLNLNVQWHESENLKHNIQFKILFPFPPYPSPFLVCRLGVDSMRKEANNKWGISSLFFHPHAVWFDVALQC